MIIQKIVPGEVCMYVCLYICMYSCMYMYKCLCVCVCMYTYLCMYVCMYVCMFVYMYACMYGVWVACVCRMTIVGCVFENYAYHTVMIITNSLSYPNILESQNV